MGHSIFKADYPLMITWFQQKGYSGSLNEMILQCFKAKLGGSPLGYPNDLVAAYLMSQGYSGDIGSMLNSYFCSKMNTTDPLLAQRLFFSSQSNDFSGGGNDANTILLLHMDTDFSDSSSSARTPTLVNVPTITGTSKFGAGAGNFVAASSQWVQFPDSTAWAFSGDFTIDFQIKLAATATSYQLLGQFVDADNRWLILVNDTTMYMQLVVATTSYARQATISSIGTASFSHMAFQRSGATWSCYLNGTSQTFAVQDSDYGATAFPDFASVLGVGSNGNGAAFLNGVLDEVRISNVARYSGNFTAPTSAYS